MANRPRPTALRARSIENGEFVRFHRKGPILLEHRRKRDWDGFLGDLFEISMDTYDGDRIRVPISPKLKDIEHRNRDYFDRTSSYSEADYSEMIEGNVYKLIVPMHEKTKI